MSTYTITVKGKNPVTGLVDQATAKFRVEVPKVDAFTARSCRVNLRSLGGLNDIVSLGKDAQEPGCADYGIRWRVGVTAPQRHGVSIAMTQLMRVARSNNDRVCTWPSGPGAGRVGTDNELIYRGQVAGGGPPRELSFRVAPSQSSTDANVTDAPTWKLWSNPTRSPNGDTWRQTTDFTDFLMARPDGNPSNIYVALAELHWRFDFTETSDGTRGSSPAPSR